MQVRHPAENLESDPKQLEKHEGRSASDLNAQDNMHLAASDLSSLKSTSSAHAPIIGFTTSSIEMDLAVGLKHVLKVLVQSFFTQEVQFPFMKPLEHSDTHLDTPQVNTSPTQDLQVSLIFASLLMQAVKQAGELALRGAHSLPHSTASLASSAISPRSEHAPTMGTR